jgi:glycosyltransferase involved in cell wall biosynthesis
MAVYNGERWLAQAVESILQQTLADFELIVVDDGSTDRTPAILDGFRDPHIVRLHHDANRGLPEALNQALAAARGELVARMDADDLSRPERLEKQVAFLDAHPDIGVVGTAMEQIAEDGRTLGTLRAPEVHELIAWSLMFDCPVFHATTMIRKPVLDGVGGYRPEFRHIEDVDLWSRLIERTRFANLPEALYVRRWHEASVCNREAPRQARLGLEIRRGLCERLLGRSVPEETLAWLTGFTCARVDRPQAEAALTLLVELYAAHLRQHSAGDAVAAQIQADFVYRVMNVVGRMTATPAAHRSGVLRRWLAAVKKVSGVGCQA